MINHLYKLKKYFIKINNKNVKIVNAMINELQSHNIQPEIGQIVENTNPGCKHFGSIGKVLSLKNLDDDKGITVVYVVSNNNGDTYKNGDVLEKTLDQLSILE